MFFVLKMYVIVGVVVCFRVFLVFQRSLNVQMLMNDVLCIFYNIWIEKDNSCSLDDLKSVRKYDDKC